MGRVMHLAGVAVVIATSVAYAGGSTQHVMVEGEPKGATVYLDDVGNGPACQPTPCGFDVAVGKYTLIVQKANFAPSFDSIDIPRRPKKPLVFSYKLDKATGTLVIESPAAKGATVTVDSTTKSKVDNAGNAHIELDSGGHQVQVTLNGKTLFEDFVTIETGQDYDVKLSAAPVQTATAAETPTETPETTEPTPTVHSTAPAPEHERYISGQVVVDVAFRRFSYSHPMMGPLSDEGEDGNVIAGPAVEVWPMEILDLPHLRALSIYFKFEFPLNHQNVVDGSNNVIATTDWQSLEASVRHRWVFADMLAVEASAGYVKDTVGFTADAGDKMKLPDADYSSIRIGGRAALLFGAISPYVAAENRVVLDGGVLPTRFSTASGSGVKGAIGIEAHAASFVARAEGFDTHYSWSFTNSSTGNFFQADGATDKIYGLQFLLGYQY
jgi:hypothetical protein